MAPSAANVLSVASEFDLLAMLIYTLPVAEDVCTWNAWTLLCNPEANFQQACPPRESWAQRGMARRPVHTALLYLDPNCKAIREFCCGPQCSTRAFDSTV